MKPSLTIFTSSLIVLMIGTLRSQTTTRRAERPFEPFRQKALDWLLAQQKDGLWMVPGRGGELVAEPGISALCLGALASKPARLRSSKETRILHAGIDHLLAFQKRSEDGSFSSRLPNYVTCAAVMVLAEVDRPGVKEALEKAQKYLLMIQNIESTGTARSDKDYGSIGYGSGRRGDLSNTQMAIDALRATGLDAQDEAIEKALVFLRRVQNLPGKDAYHGSRVTEDGRKVEVLPGSDGGAQYYPGGSTAGYDETAEGAHIPRSYGTMTYALLKCYVLAGLPADDPRLKAALNWCVGHFTLEVNPGSKPELGEKARYQGLYYYYLTLSRALKLAGVNEVNGKDWRKKLRAKLRKEQNDKGFWVNKRNGRWWENNPTLCTAYALLALAQ
ncbi:MAG: prenyltransferase/squalene oxidase repeat-containing protein [Planctomycetota bacterium]